jgi:hypothetical protein
MPLVISTTHTQKKYKLIKKPDDYCGADLLLSDSKSEKLRPLGNITE